MTAYTSEYCGKLAHYYARLTNRAKFPLHVRMYSRRMRLWVARQTEARANGR